MDDRLRRSAETALDQYLTLDTSDVDDTFSFWRDYERTNDKARKSLCNQAKIFLTPAPTSTCVERLFSTAGMH